MVGGQVPNVTLPSKHWLISPRSLFQNLNVSFYHLRPCVQGSAVWVSATASSEDYYSSFQTFLFLSIPTEFGGEEAFCWLVEGLAKSWLALNELFLPWEVTACQEELWQT